MKRFLIIAYIFILSSFQSDETIYYASWYGGKKWNGKRTASGEIFDDSLYTTAASKHYKMYDLLEVTNVKNGKSITVYVNDRGAFSGYNGGMRRLDLSKNAFSKIADLKSGVVKVRIKVLENVKVLKN